MTAEYESLGDQVYGQVKHDILYGSLGPGDRLSVSQLATKHGVSKTPVRQALDALSHEGFVEAIPRTGFFVSNITVNDVKDIFGLRRILETAAAELAAERISEKLLARLEEINTTFVPGDVHSYVEYLHQNREFHYTIALATGNKWLAETVGNLLEHMQRVLIIRLNRKESPAEEMQREHQEVIAALRDRDGKLARTLVAETIDCAKDDVLEAILRGQSHLKLSW